jgi:hypothetical protein
MAERLHSQLERKLLDFRRICGTMFRDYTLVRPGKAEIGLGPSFRYSADRVMGSDPVFGRFDLETMEAVSSDGLFLWDEQYGRPLEMAPLVKLVTSADTGSDVCYFYNRRDDDGVRFVSYHCAAVPEIVGPFEDTTIFLRTLTEASSPE